MDFSSSFQTVFTTYHHFVLDLILYKSVSCVWNFYSKDESVIYYLINSDIKSTVINLEKIVLHFIAWLFNETTELDWITWHIVWMSKILIKFRRQIFENDKRLLCYAMCDNSVSAVVKTCAIYEIVLLHIYS